MNMFYFLGNVNSLVKVTHVIHEHWYPTNKGESTMIAISLIMLRFIDKHIFLKNEANRIGI